VTTRGSSVSDTDKEPFLNRVLMLLMVAVVAGVTLMVLLAPLGMRLLFSGRFVAGARLVGILGVSLIGQMFGWFYTMYLVHRGAFTTRLLLESVWAVVSVGATWYCTTRALPIDSVAWVHVGTYLLLGALTAATAAARYGRGLVSLPTVLLGVISTVALSLLAARY
jgi:hypothetical protein